MANPQRLVVVLFCAASCAHRFGAAPGPELQLSIPRDVRWEQGTPRELPVVLENGGARPLGIPELSPAHIYVAVFPEAGRIPVCIKEAEHGVSEAGRTSELRPGEERRVIVRLPGCDVAPGTYRYEAWYHPPAGDEGARIGPEIGRIVMRASTEVDVPVSSRNVSPPGSAEPPTTPAAPPNPHFRPGAPTFGPQAGACIDRELGDRGLNAYGDPAGTMYPDGPPTLSSDVERQRMIFERYPELATACSVVPP